VSAKANVVVEVSVIGRDLGNDATTMVSRILGRIPSRVDQPAGTAAYTITAESLAGY
jgi:hypothetical protein